MAGPENSDSDNSDKTNESQDAKTGNPETKKSTGKSGKSSRRPTDYPVVEEAYQFVLWLTQAIEKFPRAHKFTIGDRLQNKSLDLVELLTEAVYSRDRVPVLRRANLALEQMRLLVRLCFDRRLLDFKGYEFCAHAIDGVGRGVGGWAKASHGAAARQPV